MCLKQKRSLNHDESRSWPSGHRHFLKYRLLKMQRDRNAAGQNVALYLNCFCNVAHCILMMSFTLSTTLFHLEASLLHSINQGFNFLCRLVNGRSVGNSGSPAKHPSAKAVVFGAVPMFQNEINLMHSKQIDLS